jgi:hypothetical protein
MCQLVFDAAKLLVAKTSYTFGVNNNEGTEEILKTIKLLNNSINTLSKDLHRSQDETKALRKDFRQQSNNISKLQDHLLKTPTLPPPVTNTFAGKLMTKPQIPPQCPSAKEFKELQQEQERKNRLVIHFPVEVLIRTAADHTCKS